MDEPDGQTEEAPPRPRSWPVRVLEVAAASLILVMLVLAFSDVVGRYVFNAPIPGGFWVVGLLLGIMVFTALPLVTLDDEHITVGLLERYFRGRVRRYQRGFALIVSGVALGFLVERMWSVGETSRRLNQYHSGIDVPLAPFGYTFAVLSAFSFIVLLVLLWRHLRGQDDRPGEEP